MISRLIISILVKNTEYKGNLENQLFSSLISVGFCTQKQLLSAEHKIQSRKSVLPLALSLFASLKHVE